MKLGHFLLATCLTLTISAPSYSSWEPALKKLKSRYSTTNNIAKPKKTREQAPEPVLLDTVPEAPELVLLNPELVLLNKVPEFPDLLEGYMDNLIRAANGGDLRAQEEIVSRRYHGRGIYISSDGHRLSGLHGFSLNHLRLSKWTSLKRAEHEDLYAAFAIHLDANTIRQFCPYVFNNICKRAQLNAPAALNNLGIIHGLGIGTEKNRELAFQYYSKASQLGLLIASVNLADCYAEGYGVAKKFTKALELYQSAIENGYPCYFNMAHLYEAENRYKEALNSYTLALEQGEEGAHCELARCYEEGIGTKKDIISAYKLRKIAAKLGEPEAQHALACVYSRGYLADKYYDKVVYWLTKSADQGYLVALTDLGELYETGSGVDKNPDMAFSLFKKAAAKGDMDAQYKVGQAYWNAFWRGDAEESTLKESVQLLKKAADQGHEEAERRLKKIPSSIKDFAEIE